MNLGFHRKHRKTPPFQVETLIGPDRFVFSQSNSIPTMLHEAVETIGPRLPAAPADVVDTLLQRERLMTTALGMGVAMPHAPLAGIDEIESLFVLVRTPLDWNAFDKRPVDIVVVTLFPDHNRRRYLLWVREVARLLRNADTRDALRHAESPEAASVVLRGRQRQLSEGQ